MIARFCRLAFLNFLFLIFALQAQDFFATHAQTSSRPSYQLNADQTQVLQITNLFPDTDCHPDRSTGHVVARQFDRNGVLLQNFTVETSGGVRSLINVDTEEMQKFDMVTIGWISRGLQTLVREGHELDMRTKLCGAAGRVEMLDAIYSSKAPRPTTVVERLPSAPASSAPVSSGRQQSADQLQQKTPSFSNYALIVSGLVFLVGLIVVRAIPAESIRARILVGVLVTIASSFILHVLGVKDELTLVSVTLLGGAVVIAVSLFF